MSESMTIREQVARFLYDEYQATEDYEMVEFGHPNMNPQEYFGKADAILSLIIKELTVIGEEEILQARLNKTDTDGFAVDDAERRIAQSQHDHTIKQLRGEK